MPGLGRAPGGGNGNPLQYACLENSMDRRAWQATFHGVAKSQTWLNDEHFYFLLPRGVRRHFWSILRDIRSACISAWFFFHFSSLAYFKCKWPWEEVNYWTIVWISWSYHLLLVVESKETKKHYFAGLKRQTKKRKWWGHILKLLPGTSPCYGLVTYDFCVSDNVCGITIPVP